MKRRAFVRELAALGACAAGLALAGGCGPLPTQTQLMRPARVGVLSVPSRADGESGFQAFLGRADELGWHAGQNIVIEDRWGNGQRDAVKELAAELARLPVDVIVAGGTAAVQAARQATSTIPIVLCSLASDAVGLGLVATLARPGGNITGINSFGPALSTKRLEILTELVPGLSRVAVLVTADNPSKPQNVAELQVAAAVHGITLQVEDLALEDLSRGFDAARAWPAQALQLIGDAVLNTVMSPVVALVGQLHLPAMYNERPWVAAGGLMSYGQDSVAQWGRAADFMDKILRGAKPADIPVEQPTRFQFVINVMAAQALGLAIPPEVAQQATEWIQ